MLLENISVGNVDHILNRNSYVKSNQLRINQEDKWYFEDVVPLKDVYVCYNKAFRWKQN